ncbi:hypothetical protein [Sulfitobacter aestuariivivens]|uniref:hypothetical protein n=1 Tax=Sulfitobacter aestuariivivens TaxID=2766981 RepID=UPI0036085B21
MVTATMTAAEGHEIVLRYDHVICCTGFRFNPDIFDADIRPELRHFDKFPAMTAQWESEETPNLWFAGTLMQSRDFKKTMSGFVHGFRYNIAALVKFIAGREAQTSFPTSTAPVEGTPLIDLIIDRISLSPALFLQPGFLGDVIHLSGATSGTHYQDVPVQWATQESDVMGQDSLLITLEFGNFGQTPTHVKRAHSAFQGDPDPFIHPVLRHYRDGELVGTMHLSDHLDSDWRRAADKEAGAGTVSAMTFADLGQTLPIPEVARQQIQSFLAEQGLGRQMAAE